MRVGLLGSVEVSPGGAAPAGLRLRGLLARLALDAGRPVAVPVLVDALWGTTPPDAADNALQALVSRLRRAVGPDLVTTATRGYRLELPAAAVDALRFGELVTAAGAAADPGTAHALLGQALGLWRGPALADVRDLPFAGPAAHRLDERRAVAVEERARLGLRLGDPAAELDALRAQLEAAPLRESTAVLLARGLHAVGRQADALAVLDRTRDLLVEQLGIDPGAELVQARLDVLRGAPAPVRPAPVTVPAAVPALSSFVGRDGDVRRVRDLLATARLVTLTGPGGAGKTRLAREAVVGAPVAELAALTAADQLPAAVLGAVGGPDLLTRAQEEAPPDTLARLTAALAGRRLVLVLDNCEHLVAGVAVLAETLLHACPQLRVLATSREPLGVPGEVLHPVDALPEADAVRLFVERGGAVRPGFAPAGDEAAAVAEICRRLDGQPLPIELAAARLRTLSPAEIATRLDDRFRLLTSGPRTALPRHQTLRAVVDWSWDLLGEPERTVASRLAVFAGGATAAAAERVCSAPGGPRPEQVFELLAALVDKSLVVAVPQPDGAGTRYRMLETIREYAAERLDESGGRADAERAHAAVVLELAEAAEPHLRSAEQLRWLALLGAEADEIDIALRRAVAGGDAATAHRIVAAMGWSWVIRGLFDDATRWVEAVQRMDGSNAPPLARAVNAAYHTMTLVSRGEFTAMARAADLARAIVADLPGPLPPMLELLGPMFAAFSDEDNGPLERLAGSSADPWVRGLAAQILASRAENDGEIDEQRRFLRSAHEEFARTGDRFGLGMVLHSLGEVEDIAGEAEAAARAYDESIALATELGNDDDLPQFVARRAALAARCGDLDGARAALRRVIGADHHPYSGGSLRITLAEVERMAGNIEAARAELDLAADDLEGAGLAVHQRRAFLMKSRTGVELAAGDPATARVLMAEATAAAVAGHDGPVAASVAETGAALLLAEGDPRGAALLLGVAEKQRGTPDRGSPEVTAAYRAVRAALGAGPADEVVRQGRELPRDEGLAAMADLVGPGSAPDRTDRPAVREG